MSLGTPKIARGRFESHLVARKHKKASIKKVLLVSLSLTAMVDMFSVLVIFLLQSFSASPEVLVTGGISLPKAEISSTFLDAPVLALSHEGVFLDQKLVGELEALQKNPDPLMKELERLRVKWQKTHPGLSFTGEISLQADQKLPSTIVSQFMGLLPSQAYSTIQLAVLGGGYKSSEN